MCDKNASRNVLAGFGSAPKYFPDVLGGFRDMAEQESSHHRGSAILHDQKLPSCLGGIQENGQNRSTIRHRSHLKFRVGRDSSYLAVGQEFKKREPDLEPSQCFRENFQHLHRKFIELADPEKPRSARLGKHSVASPFFAGSHGPVRWLEDEPVEFSMRPFMRAAGDLRYQHISCIKHRTRRRWLNHLQSR